jgi:hypothetical protein
MWDDFAEEDETLSFAQLRVLVQLMEGTALQVADSVPRPPPRPLAARHKPTNRNVPISPSTLKPGSAGAEAEPALPSACDGHPSQAKPQMNPGGRPWWTPLEDVPRRATSRTHRHSTWMEKNLNRRRNKASGSQDEFCSCQDGCLTLMTLTAGADSTHKFASGGFKWSLPARKIVQGTYTRLVAAYKFYPDDDTPFFEATLTAKGLQLSSPRLASTSPPLLIKHLASKQGLGADDQCQCIACTHVVAYKQTWSKFAKIDESRKRKNRKKKEQKQRKQKEKKEKAAAKAVADIKAHLSTLVVGERVTWTGTNDEVPEGTAGEIIEILENSDTRRVRFPGATYGLRPENLVLATAEQAAQWESTKAELDAKARRRQQRVEMEHDAQFAMARYYADGAEEPQLCGLYEEGVTAYMIRVGLKAWYDCFTQHLPEHLESVERLRATTGDDLKRMATEAHMRLDEKTKKQVLSAVRKPTVAERKEEEEKRQERAAALIVGAVVTRTGADEDVPTGTAGEIIEVEDGIRRVRFPGGTWKYKPEHLVLATAEQAAQWKALKPELDAKAAAHLATLVVGERVTWTDADDKVREGTAGEIIEILEECNARVTMARYYANGVEEPQLCDYYAAKSVRAYMTSVGLEAWYVYFAQHLPKHLESVERLRATTSADLKRMATKANMRLDEKTKKQVLSALRKCHIDRRVVRFPGATYRLRPEQLVLATTEQAAQWELTKAELDAKAAHLATLVVGERR